MGSLLEQPNQSKTQPYTHGHTHPQKETEGKMLLCLILVAGLLIILILILLITSQNNEHITFLGPDENKLNTMHIIF